MKGWLVALGFVALGAFLWATFGDDVTAKITQKVDEIRAEFSNSLQSLQDGAGKHR